MASAVTRALVDSLGCAKYDAMADESQEWRGVSN